MQLFDQVDLFLLDLDGLLVDTEPLQLRAYREACKKRGAILDWDLAQYNSYRDTKGLKQTILELFPHFPWEEFYQEKRALYRLFLEKEEVSLLPKVSAFLEHVRKKQIDHCVVTHSSKVEVALLSKKIPLLFSIPYWIVREDYLHPKPAPDGYLKALSLYGKGKKKVVGLEDSRKGVQALLQTEVSSILWISPSSFACEKRVIPLSSFPQW